MTVGETVGGYTRFQPEEFREGDTTTGNLWKSIYLGIYVYSVWWRGIQSEGKEVEDERDFSRILEQ